MHALCVGFWLVPACRHVCAGHHVQQRHRHAGLSTHRCCGCTQAFVHSFAHLFVMQAIMSNSGTAMLGVGVSSGKNRAEEAALVSELLQLIPLY